MKKIILLLLAIALIAGCTQAPEPVNEIMIQGHGDQVYTFASNIHDALKVSSNNPAGITDLGNNFVLMNIVFNGANQTDNGYFRVVLFNLLAKVPTFYSYEGKFVYFTAYYYIDDQWYNSTDGKISRPNLTEPTLWLVGPGEATGTYVNLEGNTIYLSGTNYGNLTLAGDKLALLFFRIDQI